MCAFFFIFFLKLLDVAGWEFWLIPPRKIP